MPLGSEKATLLGAAGGSSTIKMYGFGGNNSGPDPVYNNTEVKIYEESTDSWALGAVLAIGRGGNNNNLGAAWLSDAAYRNGKFWAAYGFAGSTPSAEPSNQYYNSVTNTSAAIGAAPGPSRSIVGYWSMHDKFFCGSGMKYTPNYWSTYNVVQSQAYSNDAWTTHGTGPQNSYTSFASASFSSNTNLAYMFMGRNIPVSGNMPNWGTDIYNVYSYSQSADSWTGLTNSPNNWKPQGNHWIDNIK